jgi:hypothetical protein
MVDVPRDSKALAGTKLQEILDQAIDAGADAVTIEFAKKDDLEFLFMFGNTSVGDILVDRTLEAEVMTLIHEHAGLEEDPCGVMHWESHGQNLEIKVGEYNSFGETAYTLTFPKGRQ